MSVKTNVPSVAKTSFVNWVQVAIGFDRSPEAQRRKELPDGPVPVINVLPSGSLAIPARCGVRTMRKIVPPPPEPPCAVVPYRFPSGPIVSEQEGTEPFVPWN